MRTRRAAPTLLASALLTLVLLAACSSPPTTGEAEAGGEAAGGTAAADASEATGETGEATGDASAAAGEEAGGGAAGGETGYEAVLAEVEGLEGQDRVDRLVALAEEEGNELSLYTSMTNELAEVVIDGFDEAYGIDVSLYRASSETVLQRLIQEADADFSGADVFESNGPEMFALSEEGLLVPYEAAGREGLVEGADYDAWTATRFNSFTISWNTDEVAEGEQPQSWEDLADPAWDGRLAMELSDVDWYKTLWEYWVEEEGKTEEEADELFNQMADGALMVKGHTVTGELLAAGEYAVAASNYSYLVQNLVDEGAPVAWEPPVEPIISRPNGVGLVRNPIHPATALLFTEWILSDGQQVIADFGLEPARADLSTAAGAEVIFVDLADLQANLDEWTTRYEGLVEQGQQVEG